MANPLETYLRQLIVQKKGISVEEYMRLCLFDPDYGYYMKTQPIGRGGDFITAPEISQMFGELIGLWCFDLWQRSGKFPRPHLIELGPGRGTLMEDLLRACPGIFDVHMVEISPSLQFAQKQRLQGHSIRWHTTVEEALEACCGGQVFVIANEFFDVLPIHQFQRISNLWYEHIVALSPETDNLCFSLKPVADQEQFPRGTSGDIIEHSPISEEIIQKITAKICQTNGAALIIDYGYTSPGRASTLQAVQRHAYADVLKDPGFTDLTAHVNFSVLVKSAEEEGAKVYGPTFQGSFLKEMGIEIRAKLLQRNLSNSESLKITVAVDRLTSPLEMGHLFKVLAITGPSMSVPCGFSNKVLTSCSPRSV